MISQDLRTRLKKAAPFALMSVLIMTAGMIAYIVMPRAIGQPMLVLGICLLVGFLILAIGVYFFLVGNAGQRKGAATGKMMGAAFIEVGLVIMAVGAFIYFVFPEPYGLSIGSLLGSTVAGLAAMIIGSYVYLKDAKRTVMDERSLKVQGQAGNVAFLISWILLGLLAIVAAIGVLHISYETIVWVVWMAMPLIFLAMRFLIGRRGEVV